MGLEVLFWIWVLTWMAKRGAEDLVHAVKGTPNPRYELKRAKAEAAGQTPKLQPRYGSKEYVADFISDFLAAKTEKRRAIQKAKGLPVDDMVELVREPRRHPHDPNNTRNCAACKGEVVLDGRPCPRCLAEQERRNAEWEAERGEPDWLTPGPNDDALLYGGRALCSRCKTGQVAELSNGDRECVACGWPSRPRGRHETPEPPVPVPPREEQPAPPRDGDPDGLCQECAKPSADPVCPDCQAKLQSWRDRAAAFGRQDALQNQQAGRGFDGQILCRPADTRPDATIIQFPNPKHIEKEITMSNEATGLATAIAFAEQAATAHTSFATTGAEGYVGALERGGMGDGPVGTAKEAMEASGIAADKWAAHKAKLEEQLRLKEAYQSQPDAAGKDYLLAE